MTHCRDTPMMPGIAKKFSDDALHGEHVSNADVTVCVCLVITTVLEQDQIRWPAHAVTSKIPFWGWL
jgi:hypothetical protein